MNAVNIGGRQEISSLIPFDSVEYLTIFPLLCSLLQIIATNKLEDMITLLVNKSQDDITVSVLREGAVNLVSAVFNILMSASYNANFTRNHLTQEDDRNKVGFYNLTA